jgi:hypothetical protein
VVLVGFTTGLPVFTHSEGNHAEANNRLGELRGEDVK